MWKRAILPRVGSWVHGKTSSISWIVSLCLYGNFLYCLMSLWWQSLHRWASWFVRLLFHYPYIHQLRQRLFHSHNNAYASRQISRPDHCLSSCLLVSNTSREFIVHYVIQGLSSPRPVPRVVKPMEDRPPARPFLPAEKTLPWYGE